MSRAISDLIGIPFVDGGRDVSKGVDCWGLFMVAMKRFGYDVPDFRVPCKATREIDGTLKSEIGRWERIMLPVPGCGVAMSTDPGMPRMISHFGVYVGSGKFLHTLEKTGSIISRLDDPFWKKSIRGFYRWAG